VLHRSPARPYPVAVRAEGVTIRDDSGNDYLDMSGGAAVSCLGHSHPDIVASVAKQLQTFAFAHTSFFTNEPQERLAAMLVDRIGEPEARVYFLSGGSEANEAAFKLAWQYWVAAGQPNKKIIISRDHSYHGNSLGALSASGNPDRRRTSAAPLVEWPRIPACYEYRDRHPGESANAFGRRSAGYLEDVIHRHGSDRIAAFVAETVVGSSLGVVPAAGDYFRHVREICDRHDILLIADEVMCGSGRTGSYFAFEQEPFRPDIVTLAKGIAGGYQPLAAALISGRVAEALSDAGFEHGHTYIGHATACAAGVAVQEVIDRDDLLTRTQHMGGELLALLDDRFATHPNVGDIRGRGLFAAVELVSDRETGAGFEDGRSLPDDLRRAAMDRGLICYPAGIGVDGRTVPHILLAPPMIAERRHLEEGVAKLASAIDMVLPR
jgi:adenosylmethionine-8-amino-7-oxononanoate aminotransferase